MSETTAEGRLDYPRLVREALRGVVRGALAEVAEHGLAPPHQLYLTIATGAPGVVLPGFLREAYPQTLTFVLEHQFWNLHVDDEGFEVTLRFGGTPHRIAAPFAALTAFVDPGVEFGLRFEGSEDTDEGESDAESADHSDADGADPEAASTPNTAPGSVVQFDAFRRRRPTDAG